MRKLFYTIPLLLMSGLFSLYFYVQVGFTSIVRGDEWYHWCASFMAVFLALELLFSEFRVQNILITFITVFASALIHANSTVALAAIMFGAFLFAISPAFLFWKLKFSNVFTLLMFLFICVFLLSNLTTSIIGMELYYQLKSEPVDESFVYPSFYDLVSINWHWLMFTYWGPFVLMTLALVRGSKLKTNNPLQWTRKKPLAIE
jgi:hypothetical protein